MTIPDHTLPLAAVDLVFIDVETTGLYPAFGDRVVELGALKTRGETEIDTFAELIDPQRSISPGAAAVNGITAEMLVGRPTFAELAGRFAEFINGAILVAHNAPFDFGFLTAELRLAGLSLPRNQIVDTLQIARRYFQHGSNSLGSLARHYKIKTPDAHRALGDCRTTHRVLMNFLKVLFPDDQPNVGQFIDKVSGWTVEGERTDPLLLLPPSLRGPVKRREPIAIEYVDASGFHSQRKIRLKEVIAQQDYIYLVAYCYSKKAERHFRLDRIVKWESVPDEDSPFGIGVDLGDRNN